QLLHRPQRRLHPGRDVPRVAAVRLLAAPGSRGRHRAAGAAGGVPGGRAALLARQRVFSSADLPCIALAITFGAFDWLMSLNPTWFSTIFGVYYFAGSFLSALSILAIVTRQANRKNVFGGGMSIEHTHSIGKLMLAFTCFWT